MITEVSLSLCGRYHGYGLEREAYKKVDRYDGISTTTWKVFSDFEVEEDGATQKQKHYIADFLTIELDGFTRQEHYLHKDFLGSTLSVSNGVGALTETIDYDPYGHRRNAKTRIWVDNFRSKASSRGFTGHDHVESMELIHMKGRVYDPKIGLFLSPDPMVQDPTKTQNLNRYTYVMNNPLRYTDPSGFFFSKAFNGIGSAFSGLGRAIGNVLSGAARGVNQLGSWLSKPQNLRLVASIAITAAGGWYAATHVSGYFAQMAVSAATGYASGYVASNGSHKYAMQSALYAAVANGIGSAVEVAKISNPLMKGFAHAVAGGVTSQLTGGTFRSGFLSAGVGQVVGYGMDEAGFGFNSDPQGWDFARNAAVAGIAGGLAASATGGKFEDGALRAALARVLNDGAHTRMIEKQQLARVGIDQKEVDALAFDVLQQGLDVAGMVPGFGCVADGVNAGLYAMTGDFPNALSSLQGAIGNDSAKFMSRIRNEAQDKLLSKAEAQMLKGRVGIDAHGIKKEVLGNKAPIARYDLYKDKQGNIYVKPKGGDGPGLGTGYQL